MEHAGTLRRKKFRPAFNRERGECADIMGSLTGCGWGVSTTGGCVSTLDSRGSRLRECSETPGIIATAPTGVRECRFTAPETSIV